MRHPQQIVWFATKKAAEALEEKIYAQAIANGQKCNRWSDIIVDPVLGFGVTVKDRIKVALSGEEIARIVGRIPSEPEIE